MVGENKYPCDHTSPSSRAECKHGSLLRQCEICPLEARIALLEAVVQAVRIRNKAITDAESGLTAGFDVADAIEAEEKAIARLDAEPKP